MGTPKNWGKILGEDKQFKPTLYLAQVLTSLEVNLLRFLAPTLPHICETVIVQRDVMGKVLGT